jgi:hypothetical protein
VATTNLGIDLPSKKRPYRQSDVLQEALEAFDGALVAGAGVTVTFDDEEHTATFAVDLEYIRDQLATILVAGTGITITPDDGANTITIAAS